MPIVPQTLSGRWIGDGILGLSYPEAVIFLSGRLVQRCTDLVAPGSHLRCTEHASFLDSSPDQPCRTLERCGLGSCIFVRASILQQWFAN